MPNILKERYSLFVGGRWTDPEGGKYFQVINPATEEVLAEAPDAGPADMQKAVEAAVDAQKSWGNTSALDRSMILERAANILENRKEEFARIITLEEGKPLAEARGEVASAVGHLRWFSHEARRVFGEIVPANSQNKRILVIKRPVGVTAAVTPWNFPLAMITRKVAPALAAGCSMIVKPSELTPICALEMASVFVEAGLPAGVLSVVAGSHPADLVKVLMDDNRVRKITFTGSTEVGKLLMRQAADTVKRVSLELGGHAPLVVFEDADLDLAVDQAVVCKMSGMGETCVSANRLYVQRSVAEQFAAKFTERLSRLKVGNGLGEDISVGPLIEKAALEKVERHVEDAVAKGGKVLLGGKRPAGTAGYFYEPTVITNVNETMLITREETFGPVAPLIVFDSEEEAVRLANDSAYGLAAYFFTKDMSRMFRLADSLEYGIIGVNEGAPTSVQAPFGGVKQSGIGRENGIYAIEEFLDVKNVSIGGISL